MNFVQLVGSLMGFHLTKARRQVQPAPTNSPQHFQVRTPAVCPHCRADVQMGTLNRLHAELGRWRRGTFYRPCPHCNGDLRIIVEEQP